MHCSSLPALPSPVLFLWTGFHGAEGLNLRSGAVLLSPSSHRATEASVGAWASPPSPVAPPASPRSLHDESCALLRLGGGAQHAKLPPMTLDGAATISLYMQLQALPADHPRLVDLRLDDESQADSITLFLGPRSSQKRRGMLPLPIALPSLPLLSSSSSDDADTNPLDAEISFAVFADEGQSSIITTPTRCIQVGVWHHIVASVDQ